MKIRDFLQKYLLPGSLAAMFTDQWVRSRFGKENPTALEEAFKKALAENKEVRELAAKSKQQLEKYEDPQMIVDASREAVANSTEKFEQTMAEFENIVNILQNPNLSPQIRYANERLYSTKLEELRRICSNNTEDLKSFMEKTKFKDNNISSSNNSGLSDICKDKVNAPLEKEVASASATNPASTSNTIETTSNTIDATSNTVNLPEINESNLFGYLSELKEGIANFLATLNSEQLGCISNLMGFIMIFGGMLSITTILFGQYFIDRFNLENRFPKLAKFIKLRQTINKYYLILNFVIIYLILIIYIVLNLIMFFTAYFFVLNTLNP